eukprot:scaffold49953_cov55-Phaeocystis_antarctica.AAC.1
MQPASCPHMLGRTTREARDGSRLRSAGRLISRLVIWRNARPSWPAPCWLTFLRLLAVRGSG